MAPLKRPLTEPFTSNLGICVHAEILHLGLVVELISNSCSLLRVYTVDIYSTYNPRRYYPYVHYFVNLLLISTYVSLNKVEYVIIESLYREENLIWLNSSVGFKSHRLGLCFSIILRRRDCLRDLGQAAQSENHQKN